MKSPAGWIAANYNDSAGLEYIAADGTDVLDTWAKTQAAVDYCRRRRSPVFLHLKLVRLLGHAGTDAETEYRASVELETTEARDPLLVSARIALESGIYTPAELLGAYQAARRRVQAASKRAINPSMGLTGMACSAAPGICPALGVEPMLIDRTS